MKYKINATITVTLEDISITLDETPNEELDFEDALMQKLNDKLVLLDIKGDRTSDDGLVTAIECESIDCWERID